MKENNLKFTFSYNGVSNCSIEELEFYLKNKLVAR